MTNWSLLASSKQKTRVRYIKPNIKKTFMHGIRYFDEFYKEMKNTASVRKKIVSLLFDGKEPKDKHILKLEKTLDKLKSIPKRNNKFILLSKEGKKLDVDIDYEINELEKDLVFLKDGEEALIKKFNSLHNNFERDVKRVVKFIGKKKINSFVTDRDGTVNNYCSRYMSSVQSVYNAFFLASFSKEFTRKSVIITSAPLEGILKMSVMPKRSFIYAGSKGREYQTRLGKIKGMNIEKNMQKTLDSISREIKRTLSKPDNSKFYFIGSGFQKKFGQITVARQDVNNSVPPKESENFLKIITDIVNEKDENDIIEIEDTGLDIEIILKHDDKAFSKGDGVEYLSRHMRLNLEDGNNLVCGDTSSDISMASKINSHSKKTKVIFVTKEEKLKRKVGKEFDNIYFVDNPDILVTALYYIVKEN